MKARLSVAILLFFATSAAAQQNDWLIVPGKRIGPITQDTSRADLDRIFGKENLRDQDIDDGEGGALPATLVFPNETAASLAILWRNKRARVDEVHICQSWYPRDPLLVPSCKWRTVNGVSLRTSLEKLESLNGGAFQINEWGTDGGPGLIISWLGGRLSAYEGDKKKGWLELRLEFQFRDGLTEQQHKLYDSIHWQKGVALSSDPSLRGLHPIVSWMAVAFPDR